MPQIQFIDFVVVEAELEYTIMRQSTEAFGFCLFLWVARALRTWKWCIFSCSLYLAAFSRCLGVACGIRNIGFSGDDFVRGAMLGVTVDT